MNKHILMLSVAVGAFLATPALADDWTDITTALTVPVKTATADNGAPGDIKVDTNGSVAISGTAGAIVTIDSNNSFNQLTATAINENNLTDATGILVDMTTQGWDATNDNASCNNAPPCHTVEGIVEAGTINLTGTGDTKHGLWLEGPATGSGPFTFTGDINMIGSTINIVGDSSVGVQIDPLANLDGDLTLGGISIKPTSSTSTLGVIGLDLAGVVNGNIQVGTYDGTTVTASSIVVTGTSTSTANTVIGLDLAGTVNGDVVINRSSVVEAIGVGSEAIVLTGNIKACDQTVSPGCTNAGSLVNYGTVESLGLTSATARTGNPLAGPAISIGGSIAGGFYNGGPLVAGDSNPTAVITAQNTTAALEISPLITNASGASIVLGVYGADVTDPGFSFYNRGTIDGASSNDDEISTTLLIVGGSGAPGSPGTITTALTGGLFNSGTIQSVALTDSTGTGGTSATAIDIGSNAIVGAADTYTYTGGTCANGGVDGFCYNGTKTIDQAAFVNSSESAVGAIEASISGPKGGTATALLIGTGATVPSLINSGLIQASASTTDTTITLLRAYAIQDGSGTLTYIQNNGTINAIATVLQDTSQVTVAIDLSADGTTSKAFSGVEILDQATAKGSAAINGNIVFGSGDHQIVDVEGFSTDNHATITGDISFGGGQIAGSNELKIGDFATVTGRITANQTKPVTVDIGNGGTLNVRNDTVALFAQNFHVENGGALDLNLLQEFSSGIIVSSGMVALDTGAKLNLTYGSFVPSTEDFILISAPHGAGNLVVSDLATYQAQIDQSVPFLFASAVLQEVTTLDLASDELVLTVTPKDAAALGLTGNAAAILPFANTALATDDVLGAAMVAGITDNDTAQRAYNQFAPDVSGGTRAIGVSLTDQGSGPVANRQRVLRMYGKADGEITLWGQEFAEFIKDPGQVSDGKTGFKDHGFGFVLGLDGGDPKTGWYGGAFSFYSGDVVEPGPRDSHTNSLWYMLTGYTDWRGRGLFLDTKLDVGYVSLTEKRFIDLSIPNGSSVTKFIDEADSKRPGLVGSAGFTTGVLLAYGSTTITPQLSVDGMTLREEGYTENHVGGAATGNGNGMDLQVSSYYASSLRAFVGTEIREDLNLGSFFLQPDVRVGYRYDFLNDPVKLKVNFAATPGALNQFTLTGPDPAQGNIVAGGSLSATTDAWTLGANFDFVRGDNGATTEVGTIHLLGRI